MSMYSFTSREKAAIANVADGMAKIDGKVLKEEFAVIMATFLKLGFSDDDLEFAKGMNPTEALSIIRCMTASEKRLVSAILTSIAIVDNNLADNEAKLLTFLNLQTGIPVISGNEAISILTSL